MSNTPNAFDRCDSEIDSHINYFLDTLKSRLGLEKVMALTLDDPRAALQTLLEARAALENERRKAATLLQLKAAEKAELGEARVVHPVQGGMRYSELM